MAQQYKYLALNSFSVVIWFSITCQLNYCQTWLSLVGVIFYGLNMAGFSLSKTIQMSQPYKCLAVFLPNFHLFSLAQVSQIIAMICHVRFSQVSVSYYGIYLAHVSPRVVLRESTYTIISLICSSNSWLIWLLKCTKLPVGLVAQLVEHSL